MANWPLNTSGGVMDYLPYVQAHRDFYRPLEEAEYEGTVYSASMVPSDWNRQRSAFWTVYGPPSAPSVTHGWKVHVSAPYERAQHILDAAATVCVEQDVPFKHLHSSLFFVLLHHKQAFRPQSGKFIAAYPPDEAAARKLMEALAEATPGEEGPYILGDRRWPGSRVVSYRYGAFETIPVMQPDGVEELMVPDATGQLVPDVRGLAFTLPAGVTDPFAHEAETPARPQDKERKGISFEGLRFEAVLRHSNGGGAYRAVRTDTGEEVFVKEARAHNGLHPDGKAAPDLLAHEHRVLRALGEQAPGLAPKPLGFFRHWEHTYLVTELVPGHSLLDWVTYNYPGFTVGADAADHRAYWRRCQDILDQLTACLERLHGAGYVFLDVSPRNVLVDDADQVRLIDFETAARIGEPAPLYGTPGYFPDEPSERLEQRMREDPTYCDRYGLAALTQLMAFGMKNHVIQREPAVLHHLRHRVSRDSGVPMPHGLWERATTFTSPDAASPLPTAREVDDDPAASLRRLQQATANALLAMAEPEGRVVFPTVPRGYHTHRHGVPYGTAGVVHALHHAGRTAPEAVLERMRTESLEMAGRAAPGLHTGNAGIAWVLADQGMHDEARVLLEAADRHPVLAQRATLGEGLAGVALTHLALYGHDGDENHLTAASRLRARIPDGGGLASVLQSEGVTGLLHGRVGIALLDYYLYRLLGDEDAKRRGLELLRQEAAMADPFPGGGIGFRVSTADPRLYPYLYRGSAGFALVAARYLPVADEDLARAVDEAIQASTLATTLYAGLYEGQSGLVFALAEHAGLTGTSAGDAAALDAARGLFSHAVAHSDSGGARFHGEYLMKFTADLWSGSAGVLLALTRLLDGRGDMFFTVDSLL
ncbi:class III lanthionine synthetase LanKC [Streptomyces violaceusniger]|uniref:class III lanthionine synthetase LanKC n=1 Tax=Streptomyces violaceusniger TaxID=68280 RepID=UPI003431A1D5